MTFVKRSVKDDPIQLALDAAYRILKVRNRSETEIAERLAQKGVAQEIVAQVLAKLREQNYLNDATLAKDLADKYRGAGESDAKVRERLLARGLGEKTADNVLSTGKNPLPDEARAWDALQKRAKLLSNLPPAAQIRRLSSFLGRQGYEPDVIELAMERFMAESNFNEEN